MRARGPFLIVNPSSDTAFAATAHQLLRDGASASELQQQLREKYPNAVVRERGLATEAPTWYVYREGSWVPSEK